MSIGLEAEIMDDREPGELRREDVFPDENTTSQTEAAQDKEKASETEGENLTTGGASQQQGTKNELPHWPTADSVTHTTGSLKRQ